MKRFIIWFISIVGIIIIAAAGFTGWLVGTEQGTRWLLTKFLQTVSPQVTVGRIDGNLASSLTLGKVKVELPKQNADVDKVTLSINPWYLLSGRLGINYLELQNIILLNKALQAPPPKLVWPRLPSRFLFLRCSIKHFEINNFAYKDPGGEVIKVELFRGKADWLSGTLYLKNINLRSSLGEITGSATAGFTNPSLAGNLFFLPRKPLFDFDYFGLQMKPVKPDTEEQLAVKINLTALAKKKEHLRAEGEIGLKQTGIPFHNLHIRENNRHGFIAADGELILSGSNPGFDLRVKIHDLALEKNVKEAAGLKKKASSLSLFDKVRGKFFDNLQRKKSRSQAKGKTKESPANVSGIISLKGNIQEYNGNFHLRHKSLALPWLTGQFRGEITGNRQGIQLKNIAGEILGGTVTGNLDWNRQKKNQFSWTLQGRNLNPAKIKPELAGVVNADVRGSLLWDSTTPLAGSVNINLLKSSLNKRALEGNLEARFGQGDIISLQSYIRGNGFQISVKGKPADILQYKIHIADLTGLIQGSRGQLEASGWIRWKKEELSGLLKGSGVFPVKNEVVVRTPRTELQWSWNKKGLHFQWNIGLYPSGKIEGSFVSAEPFHPALPEEGKLKISWNSIDPGFIKYWSHTDIDLQGKVNGKLQGSLRRGAVAAAQGNIFLNNGKLTWNHGKGMTAPVRRASLNLTWENNIIKGSLALNLADYGQVDGDFQLPLLSNFPLRMANSGAVRLQVHGALREKEILSAIFPESVAKSQGKAQFQITADGTWAKPDFRGKATLEEVEITVSIKENKISRGDKGTTYRSPRTELQWTWNEKGLQAGWNVLLDPSGQIKGNFTSVEPFHFSLPEEGKLKMSWNSIDPSILSYLYNKSLNTQGKLNGELQGSFRKDAVLNAEGNLAMNDGKLTWNSGKGIITTAISRASLHFLWKNNTVKGDLALRLTGYGHLTGNFQLPLLSHLPLRMADNGDLRFQVNGVLRERGMLSALFPGSVAESHGKAEFQVTTGGTWAKPDFRGRAKLEEAGAYFPQIGIRLDNAGAQAEWIADRINIQSFHFRSDSSELHGSATLWISAGTVSRYEGMITGKRIRAVYLPEIRIWASPNLQFNGDLKKMYLRGSVNIDEALFTHLEKTGQIAASSDVIIVDEEKKKKKAPLPFAIDTNVSFLLGNNFRVEAEGLHAMLEGKINLKGSSVDKLILDGQVGIVKGYYEHYGTRLDIVRGRAVFKEEPADRGSLDILALKKIQDFEKGIDVNAGVTISGTVRSPLVKLYSRPAMSDQDILSYMVIGKPYNANTGSSQKEQMTEWAAAILGGSSSSFSKRLKDTLGVKVGVESGSQSATGSKGGVTNSLVTVGKYLSPELYVAFGRSIFGDDYYLSARYSFLKHWQVETKVGLHSATDIFYRIEFD